MGPGVLLTTLGYASGIGGLVLGGWGLFHNSTPAAIAGAGLIVGWPVLTHFGNELQRPALPADEALEMAGRYNEALRVRLRLSPPPDEGVVAARRAPREGLLVPFWAPGGAGLLFASRF